jgi:hypothetical protein
MKLHYREIGFKNHVLWICTMFPDFILMMKYEDTIWTPWSQKKQHGSVCCRHSSCLIVDKMLHMIQPLLLWYNIVNDDCRLLMRCKGCSVKPMGRSLVTWWHQHQSLFAKPPILRMLQGTVSLSFSAFFLSVFLWLW